jgi:mannose-6-phosphate isomerase-like protein (cupin superfamily)
MRYVNVSFCRHYGILSSIMQSPQQYQYLSHETISKLLAVAPSPGKKDLEPIKSYLKERGIPANVVEDVDVHDNVVEVHRDTADFWIGLEGETVFTLGGTLEEAFVKPAKDGSYQDIEIRAKCITGGERVTVKKGDWLWIPAGVPHVHEATGVSRLLIIKVPQALVPLALIAGWTEAQK